MMNDLMQLSRSTSSDMIFLVGKRLSYLHRLFNQKLSACIIKRLDSFDAAIIVGMKAL